MTVSIEDRPALQVTPIRHRGWMMGPLPLWAEVAYAAREDRTNGVIAVTGNMLGIGVDVVSEPIFWHVKDGQVVGIEGGRDAKELSRVIEGVPNVRRRRRVRVRDERQVAARLALRRRAASATSTSRMGDNKNAYPGGQNSSPLHLDGVVRNATLEIIGHRRLHLPRREVGRLTPASRTQRRPRRPARRRPADRPARRQLEPRPR